MIRKKIDPLLQQWMVPVGNGVYHDHLTKYLTDNFPTGNISQKTFAFLLRGLILEFGGGALASKRQLLFQMLTAIGVNSMLLDSEIQAYHSLPGQIIVYRGGEPFQKNALFWTLSKGQAIQFARGKGLDYVLKGSLLKKDISLYASEEGGTIVCSFNKVQNIWIQSLLT